MSDASSHKMSEALGLWEPKRTLTLAAARRHSKMIKVFRWGLLALSLGLVLALVYQFASQPTTTFPEVSPDESVKMINPRYSGRTDDGLPFFVTADEAVRLTVEQNSVDLIRPVLHFFRVEGAEESQIVADTGTYDDVAKILNLRTKVDLKTDDGTHCISTHARINAQTKVVEGDEPIACTGDFGAVNGEAYEIRDNYSTFVFKNGMDAVLEQDERIPLLDTSQ